MFTPSVTIPGLSGKAFEIPLSTKSSTPSLFLLLVPVLGWIAYVYLMLSSNSSLKNRLIEDGTRSNDANVQKEKRAAKRVLKTASMRQGTTRSGFESIAPSKVLGKSHSAPNSRRTSKSEPAKAKKAKSAPTTRPSTPTPTLSKLDRKIAKVKEKATELLKELRTLDSFNIENLDRKGATEFKYGKLLNRIIKYIDRESVPESDKIALTKIAEQFEKEFQRIAQKSNDSTKSKLLKFFGLQDGASETKIKKAYKMHALKNHPDKSDDKEAATVRFQNIRAAYETLANLVGFNI